MTAPPLPVIPSRAQTLEILRMIGPQRPLLMLPGDEDGFGARWLLDGEQVLPGIATFLTKWGYITDAGITDAGTHRFELTPAGRELRENGLRWWHSLSFLERLRIRILG